MAHIFHFILAMVVVAALALLASKNRKQIRIRYVIQLLVIEVLLAWFFLNSEAADWVLSELSQDSSILC